MLDKQNKSHLKLERIQFHKNEQIRNKREYKSELSKNNYEVSRQNEQVTRDLREQKLYHKSVKAHSQMKNN